MFTEKLIEKALETTLYSDSHKQLKQREIFKSLDFDIYRKAYFHICGGQNKTLGSCLLRESDLAHQSTSVCYMCTGIQLYVYILCIIK